MEKHSLFPDRIDVNFIQYNAKLAQLKYQVTEIEAEMKEEYLDQVRNLEKKCDELMKSHAQFKTTCGQGVEAIKDGTAKAWNDLEEAFDKADILILKKRFRDSSNKHFNKCDCLKHWNDKEL